jgi:hypothetical protein
MEVLLVVNVMNQYWKYHGNWRWFQDQHFDFPQSKVVKFMDSNGELFFQSEQHCLKCFGDWNMESLNKFYESIPDKFLTLSQIKKEELKFVTHCAFDSIYLETTNNWCALTSSGDVWRYSDVVSFAGPEQVTLVARHIKVMLANEDKIFILDRYGVARGILNEKMKSSVRFPNVAMIYGNNKTFLTLHHQKDVMILDPLEEYKLKMVRNRGERYIICRENITKVIPYVNGFYLQNESSEWENINTDVFYETPRGFCKSKEEIKEF